MIVTEQAAAAVRRTLGWLFGEHAFARDVEALGGNIDGCETEVMRLALFVPMSIDDARRAVLRRLVRGGRQ